MSPLLINVARSRRVSVGQGCGVRLTDALAQGLLAPFVSSVKRGGLDLGSERDCGGRVEMGLLRVPW